MHFLKALLIFPSLLLGKDRPNILWLTLEDTSPHFIGSYGNQTANTPNIDSLAARGIRFERAFANAPVCSASRSTIITGALNETLGTGNHRSRFPLPKNITGFPKFLRAAGYFTSNNKKTDYSSSSAKRLIQESWDQSSGSAGWHNRQDQQAFFSVFNFDNSHQSRTMTHSYAWYRKEVYDKLSPGERVDEATLTIPPFYPDTPELRKHFARVYHSITLADLEIGQILDRLKDDGLMEDTIIFCYADHGEGMPRAKSSPLGLGYRVPLIISFPEKWKHLNPWGSPGSTSNELICFDDFGPTMLSLVGKKQPDWMTGRPFLGAHRQEPRPYIYCSKNRIDEGPGCARSITDGRFLYTRNFLPGPGLPYLKYFDVSDISRLLRKTQTASNNPILLSPETHETLYDLKNDPWEMNNLVQDEAHADRVQTLRTKLYEHIVDVGDVMLMPEYEIAQISKKSTPYDYGQSLSKKDRQQRLEAAHLASLPTIQPKVIEFLRGTDPILSYWAATAFRRNPNYPRKDFQLDQFSYPPTQIEFAAACFQFDEDQEAFKLLSRYALSSDQHLRLHALQRIQDLGLKARPFQNTLQRSLKTSSYNAKSSAEMTLYLLGGPDISYPDPK